MRPGQNGALRRARKEAPFDRIESEARAADFSRVRERTHRDAPRYQIELSEADSRSGRFLEEDHEARRTRRRHPAAP